MENNDQIKKIKTTIYLSESDEILLNEIYIKRLRDRNKTDKSALFCEGVRLLYLQEFGNFPEECHDQA